MGETGSSKKKEDMHMHKKQIALLMAGLTQADFWMPVGVSQSGGSRYESGRKLPASTSTLLHLVHIEGLDINQLDGNDVRVGRRLRETDPEAYAALLNKAD